MRYKIRDMQSGQNPLCQPGWIWCHESMCGMVGIGEGGALIQRLEAGETLFGRHCLRLMGVEVEGRGCANSRADKREGTRGILLSYVSRQSAYFQQQQFACACVLVHASICFHACACACAVPSYTCVRLWRHRHNQSLIGSTRCISEA